MGSLVIIGLDLLEVFIYFRVNYDVGSLHSLGISMDPEFWRY